VGARRAEEWRRMRSPLRLTAITQENSASYARPRSLPPHMGDRARCDLVSWISRGGCVLFGGRVARAHVPAGRHAPNRGDFRVLRRPPRRGAPRRCRRSGVCRRASGSHRAEPVRACGRAVSDRVPPVPSPRRPVYVAGRAARVTVLGGVVSLALGLRRRLDGGAGVPAGIGRLLAGTGDVLAGTHDVPAGTGRVPAGTRDVPAGTGHVPAGTHDVPAGTGHVPAGALRRTGWYRSRTGWYTATYRLVQVAYLRVHATYRLVQATYLRVHTTYRPVQATYLRVHATYRLVQVAYLRVRHRQRGAARRPPHSRREAPGAFRALEDSPADPPARPPSHIRDRVTGEREERGMDQRPDGASLVPDDRHVLPAGAHLERA
jgi:hypothetical protein